MYSSRFSLAGLAIATVLSAPLTAANAQTAGTTSYALQSAGVETVRHAQTGLVQWMSGSAAQPVARASAQARVLSPQDAAAAFLNSQPLAFGLANAGSSLAPTGTVNDQIGRVFVRFQQNYQNVPILGAELNVQLDDARNVISANGKSVGDLNLSVQPAVSANDARRTAVDATARAHGVPAGDLSASRPQLVIHDARVMGGPPAPPALVWRVDVRSNTQLGILELVLVNAQNGRVAVQFNQVAHAHKPKAKQRVCDAANTTGAFPCTTDQAVDNPGSSPITDVKNAFDFAELTFEFYRNRFDRNSLDDDGLKLVSTVRYQATAGQDYHNAFWDPDTRQMVYGKDFTSGKDVVGHELSHGFTDFTSHLFYYYQSGALNESLSDTFGEFIQRAVDKGDEGWLLGEDLPIGAIRNMKDPPQFNDPDKITSTLWTGDFSFQDRGGVHTNSGVGNKTAYLITDGDTFNGTTVKGIGIDKAAAIYYRLNAFILQSASDYLDLGLGLKQVCKDLQGTTPNNKSGKPSSSGKITSADCAEVGHAVTATEIADKNKEPQFWPIPAEAQVCKKDKIPSDKLFEDFEASNSTNFKFQPSDRTHWFINDFYAASNFHALGGGGDGQFDTNISSTNAVKVPAKAFLRFAHFHNLFTDSTGSHAGGVVEYKVGGGDWKRVTPEMFLDNPYNVTLKAGTGNVLAGEQAFSGFSGGWTSSRIDLSSLAGKNVNFRFRLATDPNGAFDSWMIDDVRIYTCTNGPAVASAQ